MSDELKPCPFCGSSSVEVSEDEPEQSSVWCRRCTAMGPTYGENESTSDEEAIKLWNTRAPSPALGNAVIQKIAERIYCLNGGGSRQFIKAVKEIIREELSK